MWLIVAAAVALVTTALAVVFFVQASGLRQQEEVRLQAAEVASLVAAQVTTFRGETIEEWVASTQALATENYAGEVAELFDSELREGLRAAGVESVGAVLDVFVQRIDGDIAEAFVLVRQTYTNAANPRPIEDELQMEITLVRRDGRWLADDVRVLGDPVLAPRPPAEGDAAATPPAVAPTEAG